MFLAVLKKKFIFTVLYLYKDHIVMFLKITYIFNSLYFDKKNFFLILRLLYGKEQSFIYKMLF